MFVVEFPNLDFKIKKEDQKEFIFDEVRKKWVRLSPEEWVRQNFLQYLIYTKKYPASLLMIEKGFLLNDIKKRCDIIVYKNSKPWMIVECKERGVKLEEAVMMQVLRYNMAIPVEYFVFTNGNVSYVFQNDGTAVKELAALPDWLW
jgi:hypothetical protein